MQQWDFYDYKNYTNRVIDMSWEREIDFPYSVTSAIADVTLNNYDNYFTPESGSPVDEYILPKRPIRLYSGFRSQPILQQFVGVSQNMPEIDSDSKQASFTALDWLSEMFSMPLNQTVAMSNVTTDEVLAELLQQFGLTPTQYSLAQGRNRIPYLFFERGKNAGEAFRQLMQAEMGNLWIDEQGIVRFEQRLLPVQDPVITFNDTNVESISISDDSEIINTIRIRSVIRDVQAFQPIYSKSDTTSNTNLFVVPANDTREMEVNLQDPCLSAVTPTLGHATSVSWFTAVDINDSPVSSNVSVASDELRTNTYVLTFQNDNAFSVEINAMEVWGEPAKQVDEIDYELKDEDSIEKYGEKVLDITNDFFGSEDNCDSFGYTVLDAYSEFASIIELSVKGDPSLQLSDIIQVDTMNVQGSYKVIKITNDYSSSRAKQTIRARHYEPRHWAFWDVTVWDDPLDVWAP